MPHPITTFDKSTCKTLAPDVVAALEAFAAARGLDVDYRGGAFTATEFTCKVQFKIKSTADGKTAEEADFARHCGIFGLKPEHYGQTFLTATGAYVLCGFALGASKMPIIGRRADGKRFKFMTAVVTPWMPRPFDVANSVQL